ncbi:MAG: hypothetical protein M0C28_17480 [Candidatus Moduliflexus flocculans]|nr:hypothetical protein [Candidatus Moduliflexus flocculans]
MRGSCRHARGQRGGPMAERLVGIIGGSGLYEMDGLESLREERIATPFGELVRTATSWDGCAGRRGGLPGAPRPGHPLMPSRAQLPRQHLRLQDARAWSGSSPPERRREP